MNPNEVMQQINALLRKWNQGATQTEVLEELAELKQAIKDDRLTDRPGVAAPHTAERGERSGQ